MRRFRYLATTLALASLLVACGAETPNPNPPSDPSDPNDPSDPSDPVDPSDPALIPQTYAVSECGGFLKAPIKVTPAPAPTGYCDAEVLSWSYDKATGTLAFANNRVLLNCCGERTVTLSESNGEYVIFEKDAPEQIMTASGPSEARCHCMCIFDLAVEGQKIPGGVIQVKLVREVTDANEPAKTLLADSIDLSAGSGTIVLDTSQVGMDASGRCPTP